RTGPKPSAPLREDSTSPGISNPLSRTTIVLRQPPPAFSKRENGQSRDDATWLFHQAPLINPQTIDLYGEIGTFRPRTRLAPRRGANPPQIASASLDGRGFQRLLFESRPYEEGIKTDSVF
ncbi:hypothetical protein, partial [Methylomagnum sp.]